MRLAGCHSAPCWPGHSRDSKVDPASPPVFTFGVTTQTEAARPSHVLA